MTARSPLPSETSASDQAPRLEGALPASRSGQLNWKWTIPEAAPAHARRRRRARAARPPLPPGALTQGRAVPRGQGGPRPLVPAEPPQTPAAPSLEAAPGSTLTNPRTRALPGRREAVDRHRHASAPPWPPPGVSAPSHLREEASPSHRLGAACPWDSRSKSNLRRWPTTWNRRLPPRSRSRLRRQVASEQTPRLATHGRWSDRW